MAIYTPPAPWAGPYPQAVVDNFGNNWEAYGPNQLKKPTVTVATPEDCCMYTTAVTEPLPTDDTQPATPTFLPEGKSDGDTYQVCHPNGIAMWECVNGAWELSWTKLDTGDGYSCNGVTGEGEDHLNPDGSPVVYVDQTGEPIPNGVTALHHYDGMGFYKDSTCIPSGSAMLGYIKDEDANGQSCPGQITHLWGDIKTRVVSAKTSSCTLPKVVNSVGGYIMTFLNDGTANEGSLFINDPALIPNGTIIPWIGNPLTFTINKQQDVHVSGHWALYGANAALVMVAEFSIDGGATWSSYLSGGNNDDTTWHAADRRHEISVPECFVLENLPKGTYTIDSRLRFLRDAALSEFDDDRPFTIKGNTSNYKVEWSDEQCIEVLIPADGG